MSSYKNSRVSPNIKSISSYSVPDIDCSIRLDGNESPYDLENEYKNLVLQELGKVSLNRYPHPSYYSIKSRLSEINSFPKEGILLGNGSDEIIQMLIMVFTGKTGKVLVPSPTFSMYKLSSLALNKSVIESKLDKEFDIDIKDFKSTIYEYDPDLVFLATPNNPTGNCFAREKIIEILEMTDSIVVIDEAYFDFSGVSYISLSKKYPNLMILRTMSKIGFASIRLGMLFGNPDLVFELNKARMPYNINSLSLAVMNYVLENRDMLDEKIKIVINERNKLKNELDRFTGLKIYPSDANFFLVKTDDADFLFNELIKKDILVRNLNSKGRLKNCIRITVGTPLENEKLLEALASIFSD